MSQDKDRARTLEGLIERIRTRARLIEDPVARAVLNAILDLLKDEL